MLQFCSILAEDQSQVYFKQIETWTLDSCGIGRGWGVFASEGLKKGTKIPNLTGTLVELPTRWIDEVSYFCLCKRVTKDIYT